jgi:hypothetical protein
VGYFRISENHFCKPKNNFAIQKIILQPKIAKICSPLKHFASPIKNNSVKKNILQSTKIILQARMVHAKILQPKKVKCSPKK